MTGITGEKRLWDAASGTRAIVMLVAMIFTAGISWGASKAVNDSQTKDINDNSTDITQLSADQTKIKLDVAVTRSKVEQLERDTKAQNKLLMEILREVK